MELFIVRHGIAQDQSPGQSDDDRALTPEGRRKTRQVARALKTLRCSPARIASSPLLRAHQTAQILAKVLAPGLAVESSDSLRPGAHPADLLQYLRSLPDSSVIIVGHMPHLADVASTLLLKQGSLDIVFKKAAVACISFDGAPAAGRGSLQWLMQPAHLLALAQS